MLMPGPIVWLVRLQLNNLRILSSSVVSTSFFGVVISENCCMITVAAVLCPVRVSAAANLSQLASGSIWSHFLNITRLQSSEVWWSVAIVSKVEGDSFNWSPRSYHCVPATSFSATITSRSSSSKSFRRSDIFRVVARILGRGVLMYARSARKF